MTNAPEEAAKQPPAEQPAITAEPADDLVTTRHSITIDGTELHYTVTAGRVVLRLEGHTDDKFDGPKPKAEVFVTAYTADAEDPVARPVTFAFNGGPGSSSVWLHLGLLGPRRVVLESDGNLPKPPFRLTDNQYSLLDQTDLVFIDPVSTGYSRPVEGEKAKEWHGFKKDIASVGDFIRLYTTRYNRWLSPKFLAGESYGTTRASGLSGYLQERHGLYLNGIMLVSAVLNFSTIEFHIGNDLPFILFLPAYAATAWYHQKLKGRKPLQTLLKEVEKFAFGEYADALMKGRELTRQKRRQIVEKLTRYTGLSAEFIERTDLRVTDQHFFKELLRERGETVGRLDSRFVGRDRLGVTDTPEYDPLLTNVLGPYTAAFYDYIRTELKFESDLSYEILSEFVNPWSYANAENRYINVSETLRAAMTYNPHLRVFVASGYYDLGTPYSATEYTFNHLGLHESLRGNISMSYYEAGHMMYIHVPSLERLKADLAGFMRSAM